MIAPFGRDMLQLLPGLLEREKLAPALGGFYVAAVVKAKRLHPMWT